MDRVQEYKTAQKKLTRIQELEDIAKKENETAKGKAHWTWEDKINALQIKQRKEALKFEAKLKNIKAGYLKEKNPHFEMILKTKAIFKLMGVYENPAEVSTPITIACLDRDDFAALHVVLVDTEYLKMGLRIKKNNKPVNCYTLSLVGNSLFRYRHLESRPEKVLRFAPTKEDLMAWWEKNGKKILNDFLSIHNKLEKGYREAVELYKQKKWRMAFLQNEKAYYETGVSRGTTTEKYKGILERIRILRITQKELPLLIGEVVTKEGTKDLETRLRR